MKKGFFLTFEGIDGVGKSTQIALLTECLQDQGFSVQLTREPGGGPLAEKIRHILLDPQNKMGGMAELFLYQAARAEHVEKVILPALEKGKVVLCDRFTDATIAYQAFGRGLSLPVIERLNQLAALGKKPDLTILLDRKPSESLDLALRRTKQGGDRLELEGIEFMKKVRKGYLSVAKKNPRRVKLIAVRPKPEDTQKEIQKAVLTRLKK